jgi:uncharacterized membrane protein
VGAVILVQINEPFNKVRSIRFDLTERKLTFNLEFLVDGPHAVL